MQTDEIREITWKELLHANLSNLRVPFQITLGEHEAHVHCDRILRIMPGKRVVAVGTWNEQMVVVKLFFGQRGAKRHYAEELHGVETLLSSGVPTPRVLFHGTAFKKRAHVLLLEQIVDSQNLDELWQGKTSIEEQVPLMHAVTIELATQHVLGVVQTDLHFKNFLLKGNQIYTLDGGSVEYFHEPLMKKLSLEHLALFFAQLGVGTEKLQQALFQAYARSRGWIVKPSEIEYLHAAVKRFTQSRWANYQEKIMRTCSAFIRVNKPTALMIYDRDYRSDEFLAFLANPDSVFYQIHSLLKAGNSSTVIKTKIDGKELVVKRYNVKGSWHWLRRSLRVTRAAECWRLANLLRLVGIPTAKPVAFIEKKILGLRNKSYFVMEYVPGEHLGDYFAKYKEDDAHFEKIALRVVTLLKNLAKLRISHGDLKVTNILIQDDKPILIDLDGMTEHKTKAGAERAFKKDIKRFLKNWDRRPSVKAFFEKLFQN